jgi:hypothetical protein
MPCIIQKEARSRTYTGKPHATSREWRCLFFNTGPSNTALANVTHPSVRSTAFALNIFVIHAAGDAISPPLMGWIVGRWQMNIAFLVVSAVMLAAGLLWLSGAKFLGRDTARVADG